MLTAFRSWLRARPASNTRLTFRPSLHALDNRITPTLNFATAQTFATGANPQATVTADFNQDGRADVAVVNRNDNTVSVLLNATASGGTTTFAAQQTFAVGATPYAVAAGDFNGDGRPDLVVTNATAGTVSVLLNTTELGAAVPSFAAQATFAANSPLSNPGAVAVGDFNGDGRTDIVTEGNNQLNVLLNIAPAGSSAASFNTAQAIDWGSFPCSLVAADFDGDGKTDIAATYFDQRFFPSYTNNVFVYKNTTSPGALAVSFSRFTAYSVPAINNDLVDLRLAVGDFNADGRPDLALTDTTATVRVLTNTTTQGADPSFGTLSAFGTGALATSAPVAGDFDGDGRTDLAIGNNNGTVSVLINATSAFGGTLTFGYPSSYSVGANPVALSVADFNGDGRSDLLAAKANADSVSVLSNTSTSSAVTGPVLVAQFGTTGVWRYNRVSGAWDQLTASNATSLATAANGNVIAAFGSAGVWYYRPAAGWSQLNPNVANAVAIDALGNAAASFPGFGLSLYRLSNGGAFSSPLTSVTADQLAMNGSGDVVASFAGYGVWKLSQGNWTQLSGVSALALALAGNGDVAASFAGYGVNLYRASAGWSRINGVDATSLSIDGGGSVVANFPGYGLARYIGYAGGWQTVAPATQASGVAADWGGHVYASFGGFGVWEYSCAYGWQQRRGNDANTFAVG